MSRGFPADSAESGYQRLFARELQKSDMHPTPWLACDCMPGMKDSKLVSAHDFWKSEREARLKAAPKRRAGTERLSQAFPLEAKYMGWTRFIVNLTSQSAALAADTMRSNSMFASASLTPPLPTHSAIALVVNA